MTCEECREFNLMRQTLVSWANQMTQFHFPICRALSHRNDVLKRL